MASVGAPSLRVPPGMEGVSEVSCTRWLWPTHGACCFPRAAAEQVNNFPCLRERTVPCLTPRRRERMEISLAFVTATKLGKSVAWQATKLGKLGKKKLWL